MLNLLQSFSYIISLITLTALLITPSSCKTNNYLINCGSPTTTSADNKTWYTDEDSTFAPLTANKDATKVAHVTNEDPSYSGKPPCSGARIFHSPFTYSFPISPGPKIVRLYFYTSATYDNTSVDNFFLTLKADGGNGSFTLLGCFPAKTNVGSQLPFSILRPTALETVRRLNVGGSDVISEMDSGGMSRTWYNDANYIGGNFKGAIPNPNRTLITDISYTIVPKYTAPNLVYWTARIMGPYNNSFKLKNNITWAFSVDSGFDYLIRLHFCEIDPSVTNRRQREFEVLVNNEQADNEVDPFHLGNSLRSTPVCKDYVTSIYEGSSKASLSITLRPDTGSYLTYHDVILNGLEIFKMSQPNGNLAGPNPVLPGDPNRPNKPNSLPPRGGTNSNHLIEILVGVLGSVVFIALVIASAFCWLLRESSQNYCKRLLPSNGSGFSSTSSGGSSLPSHLCHCFTLQQIMVATNNFDDHFVIGVGGFGKVYKGSITINGGTEIMVAIKRLNPSSKQGALEFHTEIVMLTTLRHVHLVSLIGFCDENGEMVLVYDYMPLGTLQDHLYHKYSFRHSDKMDTPIYAPMSWKQRLLTCIRAARGLHYLHTGTGRVIIHRDVKSTNILLDKNWIAKVSDFGISKVGPSMKEGAPTYVSTIVKGSIGYLDPEYIRLKQLTEKSDVYSFGVVLFEVLCARPAMMPLLPNEQVNLARYAKRCYEEGTLHEIVDPNVRDEIAPVCLRKFGEIAEMCVRDQGSKRPSMEEVVWYLEFALKLQETDENNNEITTSSIIPN
uniref:Protein kinase domain-containing protein n=1 Tax=Chenopodium quinoa TaxID=63459 RepID=A0A803LCB1_CHEQI